MQFGEYINAFNGRAYTQFNPFFKGVMGLVEQASKDLFLKDGIYSFWTRDSPTPITTGRLPGTNMYGVHPYLMGKTIGHNWFGVFTNLAAAQDWIIKNNETSGEVDVETIATGGVADLFFFTGSDP